MRHVRIAAGIALVLTATILRGGVHAATSEPARVGLSYEFYGGGFHLLTVDLDLAMAERRYDVTTRLQTTGFLSWFLTWSQVAQSKGTIVDNTLTPVRHRSEGQIRGRKRLVQIDYEDGQVSAVRVEPPPAEDEERDEVPLEMRREALDPITAILGAIQRLSTGRGCTGRLPVFDGRRRYDLVLTDRGRRAMPATRYSAFSGQALQCDFVHEPIAGHHRRRADPETRDKHRVQSGRVYVAAMAGSLVLPVRIEIDGDWGMTIAHLREVRGMPPAQ